MGIADLISIPKLKVPGVDTTTMPSAPDAASITTPLLPQAPPVAVTGAASTSLGLPSTTVMPHVTPHFPTSKTLDMLKALAKTTVKIPKGGKGGSGGGGGGGSTSYGGGPAQPGYHGTVVYGRSAADLPSTIPNLRTIHGVTLQAPAIASLIALHKATGAQIFNAVGSSYRSYSQQVAVYNHNHPLGLPAAPPGSSYHEQGLAMDLNSSWVNANPQAMAWLSAHGWHSGASFNDPYHWTYGVIG